MGEQQDGDRYLAARRARRTRPRRPAGTGLVGIAGQAGAARERAILVARPRPVQHVLPPHLAAIRRAGNGLAGLNRGRSRTRSDPWATPASLTPGRDEERRFLRAENLPGTELDSHPNLSRFAVAIDHSLQH